MGIHTTFSGGARLDDASGTGMRRRWLTSVTLAEALGFLVPACVGIVAFRLGLEPYARSAWVVAAGACEGFALGMGQAWAWPLPVRRLRYALLSALGAGTVWAAAMTFVRFAADSGEAPGVVIALGIATGAFGLCALGAAQWLELRHHTPAARRWIAWTALAWVLALPLSFAPSPFVDETTPVAVLVALWACAGLTMAYVMALVTWFGVRQCALRSWHQGSGPES